MKLLVFAHTPPPHHGQSYMVHLMLEGFGGDRRKGKRREPAKGPPAAGSPLEIQCYHVNARFSRTLEDVGEFRGGKIFLVLFYCAQAIWFRFRYGVTTFYYVPAPGKKSALYRDWMVTSLCRPFFRRFVLHWHASGLARWLEFRTGPNMRALTYRGFRHADLSIVLSEYGRADAAKFLPQRVAIVGNGIPDPCPQFAEQVLPRRKARLAARALVLAGSPIPPDIAQAAGPDPQVVNVLFLGHCTREKGLFDAIGGVIQAREQLARNRSPLELRLTVAGSFVSSAEDAEFRALARANPDLVRYVGFVSGEAKEQLLIKSDIFCFPSHIESFGLVLAEAMAYGLPMVTARAGAVPEVVPPGYPGLVDLKSPAQVARALEAMLEAGNFEALRERFVSNFTVDCHIRNLAEALKKGLETRD
jgi:glycosyltransferase involved in cell wall biosynthesis